ncbi:Uncharacterized protein OBRU01_10469 [Operophtera brumata]|uniref:Fatty acyl-CoA reductase n=1 Tax=Operophtera brumata TaxID=104452 RepID=A0A0L7LET6_OPEBR|nr:Uncharacterized protein OBRU01_10469 [Operophtera brumata]
MSNIIEESPLTQNLLTKEKMEKWVEAQKRGERIEIDELENSVRIADVENQAMNPTAPMLDYSEDHEFVSANDIENCYADEDKVDAKEEEKRRLTKGKAAKTEIQQFYKDQCVFVTGGTGFLGKSTVQESA